MEFLDRKPPVVLDHGMEDEFRQQQPHRHCDGAEITRMRIVCSVPIEEGPMLLFRNYQMVHRILKMINTSNESEASRDFVALFVLDPAASVVAARTIAT